jgi:SAM-dependent methyltransferase
VAKSVRQRAAKAARRARKWWRRTVVNDLESIYYRYNVSRAHRTLQRRMTAGGGVYDSYLREQLEETLRKKKLFGRLRFDVIPLIDMLASKHDFTDQSVLCVGCRNDDEIRYFRRRGAGRVIGIDLYDAPPDIVTMDMHDMSFADSAFQVVYSRHSFEHAFDKRKAGQEFVRVLDPDGVVVIEVPANMKGGADYNLFARADDVLEAFAPHVGDVFWNEYLPKDVSGDDMDIIRVMFRVKK